MKDKLIKTLITICFILISIRVMMFKLVSPALIAVLIILIVLIIYLIWSSRISSIRKILMYWFFLISLVILSIYWITSEQGVETLTIEALFLYIVVICISSFTSIPLLFETIKILKIKVRNS